MRRSSATFTNWINTRTALLTAAVSLVLGWYLLGGFALDLGYPLVYAGDGHFYSWLMKRVLDGQWVYQNAANGFPFGSDTYDFPIPDVGSLLIVRAIGLVSVGYPQVLNIYIILSFPFTAFAGFMALRFFSVSLPLSAVGALLFSLLPFHFLRLGHTFYVWYFVVPIFSWVGFRLYIGESVLIGANKTARSFVIDLIALITASLFGIYYAFFGALMLSIAGIAGSVQNRSPKRMISTVAAVAVVSATVLVTLSPSIAYKYRNGPNPEAAARLAAESEIYGLKIAQLLLPRADHRSKQLGVLTTSYNRQAPLVNENSTATLGLIGSAGFLFLVASVFVLLGGGAFDPRVRFLALVCLGLILFCMVGGFSSLFALLVSPQLRGWNRVSVFIAFFSIAAFMIVADNLLGRISSRKYKIVASVVIAVGLAGFGVWDQTTEPSRSSIEHIKAEYNNDYKFVKDIEALLPERAAVYQLPYIPFPAHPPLYRLKDYGLLVGYLHSVKTKWSYGTMKGREGNLFYRELAKQPLSRQLEVAKKMGFSGVYVDTRGFKDGGVSIEQELGNLLGRPPTVVSGNSEKLFFLMCDVDCRAAEGLRGRTPVEYMHSVGFVVDK